MASTPESLDVIFNAGVASSLLFIKLSGELRNIIWRFALIGEHHVCFTRHGVQEPGLLVTCRLIWAEAGGIFYHENNVQVTCENYDSTSLLLAERKFKSFGMHLRDAIPRHRLRLGITGTPHWENWMLWLQRMHSHSTQCAPSRRGSSTFQKIALVAMLQTMKAMVGAPWSEVEGLLKLHRPLLVKCNPTWAVEHALEAQLVALPGGGT